jgi:SSS family solute:Na+ symporter
MFTAAAFREDSRRLRGVPWWRNYRVQAGVLLALTTLIVILFR